MAALARTGLWSVRAAASRRCAPAAARPVCRIMTAAARLPAPLAGRHGLSKAVAPATGRHAVLARMAMPHRACFSSDAVGEKYKSEIFDLTNFYMEAKDALEDAHESWETTYFDDDFEAAREAVDDMKSSYEALRDKCTEEELPELDKIVGLKLEEVKAAFEQIEDMAIEDE